jgi:hypothetical protein
MSIAESRRQADLDKPALARVCDYVLGGARNFHPDRELARRILQIVPGYRQVVEQNRAFLRHATVSMLAAGVDQFLDLGCGLPGVGALHELVHVSNPSSPVVCVDHDPVVTAGITQALGDDPRIGVIQAGIQQVDVILDHPVTQRMLDPDRPVGVFALAVLHCLRDSDTPAQVLRAYHDRLPAGSRLAASHGSGDNLAPEITTAAVAAFADAGITVVSRTRQEFAEMLGPWRPDPDGVVPLSRWRPVRVEDLVGASSLGYSVLATSDHQPGSRRWS